MAVDYRALLPTSKDSESRESYFTAVIGERPSATWRGLLRARECLQPGIHRTIGNGQSMAIWGDQWLKCLVSGRIITRRPLHSTFPNTVADLIDWNSGSWNVSLIQYIFWAVDVHSILQVAFGSPTTEGKMVWAFSKSGRFTVRLCYYRLLQGKIGAEDVRLSLANSMGRDWNWIWSLRVPPKVRMFLWRACHEILPTRVVLMRRHVGTNPYCQFCSTEVETVTHVLFVCPFFSSIWYEEPFAISIPMQRLSFAASLAWLKS